MKVLKKIEYWLSNYAPCIIAPLAMLMIVMLVLSGAIWSIQLFLKVLGVM